LTAHVLHVAGPQTGEQSLRRNT